MPIAQINRSLTNIRTELEFLLDSDVIDNSLYKTLVESLPKRYSKDEPKWGINKVKDTIESTIKSSSKTDSKISFQSSSSGHSNIDNCGGSVAVAETATALSDTSLNEPVPPSYPPAPVPEKIVGYYRALYDYDAREMGDLLLYKGDKLAVVEHLSADWWRGFKLGHLAREAGIFPSNYVTKITEPEFFAVNQEKPCSVPSSSMSVPSQNSYQQPPLQQYQMQQQQQKPSYGGFTLYPLMPVNYGPMQPQQSLSQFPPYAQPQQQQQQQQVQQGNSSGHHSQLSKFGSKLGNAAIFGAGATIGSDLVNKIF